MIQYPLPPGREFQTGYLPEWKHFGDETPAPAAMPDLTTTPPAATAGVGQADMMPLLNPEKGSSSAETASFYGGAGSGGGDISTGPDPFHGVNPQWVAAEPGMMSLLGLSTGTAVDEMGYMHDATVFDPGAAIGGLVGGAVAGPLGSAVGGMAGRQGNWNYAIDDGGLMTMDGRNVNAFDVLMNPERFSHGERFNAGEYMDALASARESVSGWSSGRRNTVDKALAQIMGGNAAFGNSTPAAAARQTVGTGAKAVTAPAATPNRSEAGSNTRGQYSSTPKGSTTGANNSSKRGK